MILRSDDHIFLNFRVFSRDHRQHFVAVLRKVWSTDVSYHIYRIVLTITCRTSCRISRLRRPAPQRPGGREKLTLRRSRIWSRLLETAAVRSFENVTLCLVHEAPRFHEFPHLQNTSSVMHEVPDPLSVSLLPAQKTRWIR